MKVHHAETMELAKTVLIDTIAHVYVASPAETARRVGNSILVIKAQLHVLAVSLYSI